jgi:hypothetical protein
MSESNPVSPAVIEQLIVKGDLSSMTPAQRNEYYVALCNSMGLNPLTQPFEYLTLNNKLVLYAKKAATDQLRTKRQISVTKTETKIEDGYFFVTAYAKDLSTGREDSDLGVIFIDGLRGEQRQNAMMKAFTKAKRRVTLSICGLGLLDETEVEDIPKAKIRDDVPKPVVDVSADVLPTPADELVRQAQELAAAIEDAEKRKQVLEFIKTNRDDVAKIEKVILRLTK